MDKKLIKLEIERIQASVVEDLEASRERLATAADIDENETIDPEDFSRQNELGNMATRLKFKIQNSKNELEYLNDLPMDTGDEVKEGSLVITDSYVFYVSIPVSPFDMEGKHVVSISSKAPVYHAMRGKKAGDSFEVAGKTYQIQEVL